MNETPNTSTTPTMKDRCRIVGEVLDHIASLDLEVCEVTISDRLRSYLGHEVSIFVMGGEEAVDSLARYLALDPENEPDYGNYRRVGSLLGLRVAVWSGRTKKPSTCDADRHTHQAASA